MRKRFNAVEILVLIAAILFALPVILIFVTGFKPDAEIVHFHGLLPRQWTTENFREIFASPEEIPIARWLFNSVFISSMVTLLVLAVDSLAAYALARLPLSRPALATLAIFTFIGSWNDLLGPLVFLDSVEKYTLPVGVALFQTSYFAEYGLTLAASLICTLPIIVIFLIFQKQIIHGIASAGLKE